METEDPKYLESVLERLLNSLANQALYNKLGLAIARIVKERTRKGVDVTGSAFEPYSQAYAKKREKRGLPVDTVTLQFSRYQGMMSKIDHVVNNELTDVEVFINDEEKARIASYHNIKGVGKPGAHIRKFWGTNDEENRRILGIAQVEIKQILLRELPT